MIVYPDKSPGIYLFMFYLKSGQVRRLTVAYEDFVKAPWRFMFDLPEGNQGPLIVRSKNVNWLNNGKQIIYFK